MKKGWKESLIFNRYIKKKKDRYTEEEIDEMVSLNVGQLEYFYLIKKNIIKFKEELDDYTGAICREDYPGFQQRSELYKDLKEDVSTFVIGCLEGKIIKKGKTYEFKRQTVNKNGELVTNKFPSYLKLLIRWELLNFFNKYNIKRVAEVDFSLCNSKTIENELNVDFFIKKYIIDFKLDLKIEEVYDYLIFKTYTEENLNELKVLCWLLKNSF